MNAVTVAIMLGAVGAISLIILSIERTRKARSDEERKRELFDMAIGLYGGLAPEDSLDLLYRQTYREMVKLRNQRANYNEEFRDSILIWQLRNEEMQKALERESDSNIHLITMRRRTK